MAPLGGIMIQNWEVDMISRERLTFLIMAVFLLFENVSSYAHELDTENEKALRTLLPIVQELYDINQSHSTHVPKIPAKTIITQGVVEDYDALIEHMLLREVGPSPIFMNKARGTKILNVSAYNRGHRRLPDNLTLFYPGLVYGNSGNSCDIECRKLLLEGYVKTVTIVSQIRPNKKTSSLSSLGSSELLVKSDKPEMKNVAKVYSKGPCKVSQITQLGRQTSYRNQYQGIGDLPILDLCITNKEADVPQRGIYFNQASRHWPDIYPDINVPFNKSEVFTSLENIKVTNPMIQHWSMDTIGTGKNQPVIRFEQGCFKVEPPLPDSVTNVLVQRQNSIIMRTRRHNLPKPKIWHDQGMFCYGPKRTSRFQSFGNNFFPVPSGRSHELDFGRIMTDAEIIEKINGFELETPKGLQNPDLAKFENTINYLETSYPSYYQNILPGILPKIMKVYESYPIGSIQRLSKFPADSLKAHTDTIGTFMAQHLKQAGCEGWVCDEKAKVNPHIKSAISLLSATGKAGIPLLQKAEVAGLPGTYEASLCMSALTPETEAEYLNSYKSKIKTTIAVLMVKDFPIPEAAPVSDKVKRLIDQIYMSKKPDYLSKFSRQYGGININSGYSFQKDRIVFYGGIDAEIEKYLQDNNLMKYLETITQTDYAPAKALSVTSHAKLAKTFLENRLESLEKIEAVDEKNETENELQGVNGLEDNVIFNGQNIGAMATKSGQRQREIKEISLILNDWKSKVIFCPARIPQYNY